MDQNSVSFGNLTTFGCKIYTKDIPISHYKMNGATNIMTSIYLI